MKSHREKLRAAESLSKRGRYLDALILLRQTVRSEIMVGKSEAETTDRDSEDDKGLSRRTLPEVTDIWRNYALTFELMEDIISRNERSGDEILKTEFIWMWNRVDEYYKDLEKAEINPKPGSIPPARAEDKSSASKTNGQQNRFVQRLKREANLRLSSAEILFEEKHHRESIFLGIEAVKTKLRALSALAADSHQQIDRIYPNYPFLQNIQDLKKPVIIPILENLSHYENDYLRDTAFSRQDAEKALAEVSRLFQLTDSVLKRGRGTQGPVFSNIKKYSMRYLLFIGGAVILVLIGLIVKLFITRPLSSTGGLSADYFLGTEFQSGQPVFTRVDSEIEFDWSRRPPAPNMPLSKYSVRWTGEIYSESSRESSYFVESDDGVRLWVDDKLTIDRWRIQGATISTGRCYLTKGWHRIKLEYFQEYGDAVIRLLEEKKPWGKRVIPSKRLKPGS